MHSSHEVLFKSIWTYILVSRYSPTGTLKRRHWPTGDSCSSSSLAGALCCRGLDDCVCNCWWFWRWCSRPKLPLPERVTPVPLLPLLVLFSAVALHPLSAAIASLVLNDIGETELLLSWGLPVALHFHFQIVLEQNFYVIFHFSGAEGFRKLRSLTSNYRLPSWKNTLALEYAEEWRKACCWGEHEYKLLVDFTQRTYRLRG